MRRLAGLVALVVLLAALPAPLLAAPAGDSSAGPGAVVLEWVQGFLTRLGLTPVPIADVPKAPTSLHQRLASGMDPDGVAGYGDTEYSQPSEEEESSIGG